MLARQALYHLSHTASLRLFLTSIKKTFKEKEVTQKTSDNIYLKDMVTQLEKK
jgi:hypothetical protein